MPTKIDGNSGVLQSYDFQALTTGFSYTFASGTTTLIINPAGTLATGTITMPATPADGMVITFMTTQQITALTLSANTGQSIGGSQVTAMAANSSMSFVYRQSNTTWYRNSAPALGNVGTAPVYAARAWVNFNGTGTVAIRASGNVSSITDNAAGNYTVNFTTAMPDANYSVFTTNIRKEATYSVGYAVFASDTSTTAYRPTASTVTVFAALGDSSTDTADVYVGVFR